MSFVYFNCKNFSSSFFFCITDIHKNSPSNVYEDTEKANTILPMIPTLGIRQGESIYDFTWFPSMNAQGKKKDTMQV